MSHLPHIYRNTLITCEYQKHGSLDTTGSMQYNKGKLESRNTCRDTTLTASKWMCPLGSVTAGFA